MFKSTTRLWIAAFTLVTSLLLFGVSAVAPHGEGIVENGLFFVDYRNLEGGTDGILLMNLDPDSEDFGKIIQNFELGQGVVPHHLYYNSDESRLYNTALGGEFLYEIILERDENGLPTITEAIPVDVGSSIVGEDMYFSEDGSRFWMTFMGGFGGAVDGTVGVFDAQTNALIETISAPVYRQTPQAVNRLFSTHTASAPVKNLAT